MIGRIDYAGINQAVLERAPSILHAWLPGGQVNGREYVCGNLSGDPGESLSINLGSGQWKDFATGEGGNDAVSLFAAINGLKQGQAARQLQEELGKSNSYGSSKQAGYKNQSGPEWMPIIPVPQNAPGPITAHFKLGTPSAGWTYRTANGGLVGYVCRFDKGNGDKEILPQVYARGPGGRQSWRWQSFPKPRPLYQLDVLSREPGKSVLITEGEKAADAAQRFLPGHIVMTWPGGSKAVRYADFTPLRGHDVVIWPDADSPGIEAAQEVAKFAQEAGAASVRLIASPAGVKKGWDAADAERERWSQEQIYALVNQAHAIESQELPPIEINAWTYARETFPRKNFPWHVMPRELEVSLKQLARSCSGSANPLPGYIFCILGAAIGNTLLVEAKISWHEPLIFWCLDIRESGDGKTVPMRTLSRILNVRQEKEHERFKADSEHFDLLTPKEKKQTPPPVPARGYFASDTTIEGLHADLDGHPTGGLALLLNEASSLLTSQGQYKGGKGSDREAWLRLWDGNAVRIVRSSKTSFITGARVQVAGGIQPETFAKVFNAEDGIYLADGTIFRGLYTYEPPCHIPMTQESWEHRSRETWEQILEMALLWSDRRKGREPHLLRLTPAALERLIAWRNNRDASKIELPPIFRGFVPKSVSYALRLAGVLHCLNAFAKGLEPALSLDEAELQAGIDVAEFYLGQAVDAASLLSSGKYTPPVEVSERTALLAQVLEGMRQHIDNGRLAVGFVQGGYNLLAPREGTIKSPHAMGALLRSAGLTISAGRHHANGKAGVRCLQWDEKTEELLRTLKTSNTQSPQPGSRVSKELEDNEEFEDFRSTVNQKEQNNENVDNIPNMVTI